MDVAAVALIVIGGLMADGWRCGWSAPDAEGFNGVLHRRFWIRHRHTHFLRLRDRGPLQPLVFALRHAGDTYFGWGARVAALTAYLAPRIGGYRVWWVMRDGSEFEFGYMLFRRSVDRFVRQSHDEVRFERVGR